MSSLIQNVIHGTRYIKKSVLDPHHFMRIRIFRLITPMQIRIRLITLMRLFDANPDFFMRIRIRIRLLTLMQIRIRIQILASK